MKTASSVLLIIALVGSATGQTPDSSLTRGKTPGGVEYGIWGPASDEPAPILFMLAGTIDSTLGSAYFRQCGNELAEHGYRTVSIDIPCHGTQTREGEPAGLSGWSYRAAREENFVTENNARLSEVLDHLIETNVADPDCIAIGGTSRGGFLAIHFAAHDARVKCVVAFAPVTDPAALNEFHAIADHPFLAKLNPEGQAEKLAGRPVWIVIGDQDERVGTDRAVSLAQAITNASRTKKLDSRVELHVMPEPRGHTTPRGSSERAAKWILEQFNSGETTNRDEGGADHRATQPSGREMLFVDDHHILYRSGTKRVFHPAKLNPTNPVIREDQAWEMAIGWTSVVRHANRGKYAAYGKVWLQGPDGGLAWKHAMARVESSDFLT